MKRFIVFFSIIVLGIMGALSYQYISITNIGESATPEEADVIIILGAGVWANGPSPALSARVQYAAQLFQKGYAKEMIVSGGLGQHPPTEAEVMEEILVELGVEKQHVYQEKEAVNTKENIEFSKQIMDQHGWNTAIIVTDAFHMKRALLLAKDSGVEATGAPVKESVLYQNKALKLKYTLREVLAMTQYNIQKIVSR